MSLSSADSRKPLVDYGVQIRFIKDLHDTAGVFPDKTKSNNNNNNPAAAATPPSSKYGVAVRVQGISGQPYVVLKDGEKGDSYGVQLNTPTTNSGPTSPYNSLPKTKNNNKKEPEFTPNPYSPPKAAAAASTNTSPVSAGEEEDGEIFGSPLKRPPGDGQAGTHGGEEEEKGGQKKDEKNNQDEYNEAGLKPVKLKPVKPPEPGFSSSSLGRKSGKQVENLLLKHPSASTRDDDDEEEEAVPAIDTNSLAPINKLISKFNSGATGTAPPQARGRTGARQRLRFDERRRSRSLDARKDSTAEAPVMSPTLNPYAQLMSSSPVGGNQGKIPASVAKATALETPKASFKTPDKFVSKDTTTPHPPPAVAKKPEILPRSQSVTTDSVNGDEAQVKQAIYNILKNGTSENDASLRRKVNQVYDTTSNSKKEGSDGSLNKGNLEELQEQLQRCRDQLQQAHDELAVERMAREKAESRLRLQEDQLAELQEDLRRFSEMLPPSDSLQTDVMALQADLAEAAMLRQRQEDTLRQRERELTALKGALKEEVECHDREMEAVREQYGRDMEELRRSMEQVTQSQQQIEEERQRVNASMSTLEEELETYRDEEEKWKEELEATSQELNHTKEKLEKCRSEREEFEGAIKNLQDSLAAMQKNLPDDSLAEELRRCHDDLKRTRADLDKQKKESDRKNEALENLKKENEEKKTEMDKMKEKFEKEKEELEKALDKAKEASTGKTVVDHEELQETNNRLRERLARMTRLHSSLPRSSDAEEAVEALEDENRSLKTQLEEAKRGNTRLSKEKEELNRRLEERDLEREALRRGKSDLEEQKRLLDRALEKINKEMEVMMGDSRHSVAALQTQLDEYRDRSRKDLMEAQRNSKDRLAELQRAQSNMKVQQEEVSRLKRELLVCSEERDGAQLERDLLSNRLKHLEGELEAERSTHGERAREVRGLEDKIKTLEIELDEEKSSVELLNDRINRSRDQVDQLRSELMQERSARHDLEMDKSAIERQVKELKSRVADMEGQTRPSAGITLLENKVQELEERLRSEEREKSSIQASQRRTERKLKEVNATLDQERSQHVEQRDQLSLRVKALKRQLDESEGEVERLEGVRRKFLRDLEEQQELQEALRAKVTALETELKWKQTHRSTLSSEEDDGLYDNSITSLLNESHLQTSNC